MTTKPRKWRWVTRNPGSDFVKIWPTPTKPVGKPEWKQQPDHWQYTRVCAAEFLKLTGITVPTTHPIRLNFHITPVTRKRKETT